MKAFLGRLGRRWLRIGAAMGNFQMMVLLSATYWLIVPLIAIPLKLFGDPLRLRARRPAATRRPTWLPCALPWARVLQTVMFLCWGRGGTLVLP